MGKCHCESLHCDHYKKHDRPCDNDGSVDMQYVGKVCQECAEKIPLEFHVHTPITYEVPARIRDNSLQFYWLDKWRPVRYWDKPYFPGDGPIKEALRTFKMNVGKSDRLIVIKLVWEKVNTNPRGDRS